MKASIWLFLLLGLAACKQQSQQPVGVDSPSKNIHVEFLLDQQGRAGYLVSFNGKTVVDTSFLGMDFLDQPALSGGLTITGTATSSFDQTWETVWGDRKTIENKYNELAVSLKENQDPGRMFRVVFRVYDDGLGFRYEFPRQNGMSEVVIMDENTEFGLTDDHLTWWQPGDWDIYEHLYHTTKFSEIDATANQSRTPLAQSYIPENAVNTPVTMKTNDGIYLSFHEAALYNYSSMTLKADKTGPRWVSELVGSPDSSKVKIKTPFKTPWRTIQIADRAGALIESSLILNLNEPNKIKDVSWIKPTKYVGIWWEMHLGKSSWDMAGAHHGATTANAKRYIDFAAANGIPAMLVEGWNTGWELWWDQVKRENCFDFVTPYADFDLQEVLRYGKEKGVSLISHHETASAVTQYEQQMDTAFTQLEKLGIHAVKTGYVGTIIPKGEYHQGQWMVNHFQRVIELAAKHKVMVDAHETIKDTGIRRTWPNFMAREVFRGQEFNAWSADGGNPPEHLTILPFTIMLGGPMDYTPGIFNIKFDEYKKENQVNSTLAYQLALYVTISSPLQMAADLPEHYEGKPAFQFIRDVAVNWDETKVLNGEPGDYLTIVRKERDGDRWFLGSITDENPRELEVKLDFLPEGRPYTATIYSDGPNAHWNKNPLSVQIVNEVVDSKSTMKLRLAAGGGTAISFVPMK